MSFCASLRLCVRSVSPNAHPINLHLLWKYSAAVGIADEVSTYSHVEENEEWSLKLRRAVDSTRDVCLSILRVLQDGFGNPKYAPCPLLVNMVAAGKLGVKSGEGFYNYGAGNKDLVVSARFSD